PAFGTALVFVAEAPRTARVSARTARRPPVGSRLSRHAAARLGSAVARGRLVDPAPRIHRTLPLGIPPARSRLSVSSDAAVLDRPYGVLRDDLTAPPRGLLRMRIRN